MLKATLQYDEEALATLCLKHHVRRLDLFGSRAKGTARDGSDVDLLVEFEPGRVPGLLGFIALQEELADLLGAEVDLVSSDGLSPYMRDEILASRSSLYEG
jgi:predicted nucleotidyltransferase